MLVAALQAFLYYPCGRIHNGKAIPFHKLCQMDPLDPDALRSGERVWALFDRNLDRVDVEPQTRPDWTTIYYPADVCANQEGVPRDCKRLVYHDERDSGREVIVPARVHMLGDERLFLGFVQVGTNAWLSSIIGGRVCRPVHGELIIISCHAVLTV